MIQRVAQEFDVIVVGAGAAGMTSAITAKLLGLDVLLVEKEPQFGGTTARSGGWLWIPNSPQARAAGVEDDIEKVQRYLRNCVGDHYDTPRIEAYLRHGPEMVQFLEDNTAVRFHLGRDFPDYHPQVDGGLDGGRCIGIDEMSGHDLGEWLPLLAPPLRTLSFLGMVIGSGTELKHFFNVTRSLSSAYHASRRMLSHAFDLVRHGRSMRLVHGGALAGRLGKSVKDLGIPLWLSTSAVGIVATNGAVTGLDLKGKDGSFRVQARRAVVLAAGGFPHDTDRRRDLFPENPTGAEHWTLAPRGNTGDGIRLGESVGGTLRALPNNAAWAPVSKVPNSDGTEDLYPHFVDRGKPGIIAVLRNGRRFVNEGDSYHDVVRAMMANPETPGCVRAYLICDHTALRRYGLGVVKPYPVPFRQHLRTGYLTEGKTLEELASRLEIDVEGLKATCEEFSRHAKLGVDPLFHRGSNSYNRFQGNLAHFPNPCLAPLAIAPFYGVRLLPGSLGTFAGLETDEFGRALDTERRVIQGLYAVGNDMASVFGGDYPGGGITLGPAMTFGFVAGKHLAQFSMPAVVSHTPDA